MRLAGQGGQPERHRPQEDSGDGHRLGNRRAQTTPRAQTTAQTARRTSSAHLSLRSGSRWTNARHIPTPAAAEAAMPAPPGRVAPRPLDGMGEVGHAGGEVHLGDETECVGGPGRRGDDVADVAQAPLAADHGLEGPGEGPGQVADRVGRPAGDVEPPKARRPARQGQHVGPGDIGHVHEVPRLSAVLVDLGSPAGGHCAAEDGGHAGVRRVAGHPRPVDVLVAEGDSG